MDVGDAPLLGFDASMLPWTSFSARGGSKCIGLGFILRKNGFLKISCERVSELVVLLDGGRNMSDD